jgi:hypothetical protein
MHCALAWVLGLGFLLIPCNMRLTDCLGPTALDLPFLLLPFRPTSDPSAVRTFVRHFFDASQGLRGDALVQELRMTEPMVCFASLRCCFHIPGHR